MCRRRLPRRRAAFSVRAAPKRRQFVLRLSRCWKVRHQAKKWLATIGVRKRATYNAIMKMHMRLIVLGAALLAAPWTFAQELPEAATGRTAAKSGTAKSYMVVAANPLAAKAGTRYTGLLKSNEAIVAKNVTENIFDRHMKPLFIG